MTEATQPPQDQPDEHWRPVVGYEDTYMVSNQGRVWSRPRRATPGGLVSTRPKERTDHRLVRLSQHSQKSVFTVHTLVATAFIGPRPDGLQCRHLDSDPTNNNVENLRWGTPRENTMDSVYNRSHFQVRKTHCKNGHPFDETNTKITSRQRMCIACQRFYAAERIRRNQAKRATRN